MYASAETHTWIQKATDLAGVGTDAIRWIPTGVDLRMDTAALRTVLDQDRESGERPLMVVGTFFVAGTLESTRQFRVPCESGTPNCSPTNFLFRDGFE